MRVAQDRCTACGYCLLACPFGAISSDGIVRVDPQRCLDCGACVPYCPNEAIVSPPFPARRYRGADQYDVIIIGSGIGGMMAGAALARAGRRVAILERLVFPGGRYTEIRHNGYLITTGAWTPPGPGSNIGRFLQDMGAEIAWVTLKDKAGSATSDPQAIFRFPDGRSYPNLIALLRRDELKTYLRLLRMAEKSPPPQVSTQEYLASDIENDDFLAAVNALVATAGGIYADEMPASEFFRIVSDLRRAGDSFGYPVGGPKALIQSLQQVFKAHGGHLLTRTPVQEILVGEQGVSGVRLASGETVRANIVIHNGGIASLRRLLPPDRLPASYRAELDRHRRVDCAALILLTHAPLWEGSGILIIPYRKRVVGLFCASYYDPGVAPAGHHQYDAFFPVHSADRPAEFRLAMADLHDLFPHLDEVLDEAIPMFFVGGWPGTETGQYLGMTGNDRLDPQTPLPGLYVVGMDVKGSGAAGDLIPVGVRDLLDRLL